MEHDFLNETTVHLLDLNEILSTNFKGINLFKTDLLQGVLSKLT